MDGLAENDTQKISAQVENLSGALNQILAVRADVGAKLNRLESTDFYWDDFKTNIQQMLSDTEDVDITQAMTDLMFQETAYQASLSASARVIQPSLIDFIR